MAKHKYIHSPEYLWELWTEYKAWCKENPMTRTEFHGKDAIECTIKIERPLDFFHFETWVRDQGVINDLGDYEKDKDGRYTEYAPIIARIKRERNGQLIQNALVKTFDSNLTSRITELADQVKNDISIKSNLDQLFPSDDEIMDGTED